MKKIFSILLLCAAVAFTGCDKDDKDDKPASVPVTGVSLDKATLALEIGKTATLAATIAPKDATVGAVTWSSDKTGVATVDDKGAVTGVADGTATITVKTEDGGKTATCIVTVSKAVIAVTEVKLDKAETSILAGETETLVATVLPDNAAEKAVTWISSDESVATVADGVVTAVKAGEATITVTSASNSDATATCKVTVTKEKTIEWAAGNLVAEGENGAKIGTATDGGLYFQFGSLVGWSETGDPTIAVSPTGYTGSTTWNEDWTGDPATDDAVTGKGDPCRFYLGGTWRLPTNDECVALFNNGGYPSGAWSWNATSKSATNSTLNLAFPASGYRSRNGGSLSNVGTGGFYWSASPKDASIGYYLNFYSSSVNPSASSTHSGGLLVRCVQEK